MIRGFCWDFDRSWLVFGVVFGPALYEGDGWWRTVGVRPFPGLVLLADFRCRTPKGESA